MISTMMSTSRTPPVGVPCVVPAAACAEGSRTLKGCGEEEAQTVLAGVGVPAAVGDMVGVADAAADADAAAVGVQVGVAAGLVPAGADDSLPVVEPPLPVVLPPPVVVPPVVVLPPPAVVPPAVPPVVVPPVVVPPVVVLPPPVVVPSPVVVLPPPVVVCCWVLLDEVVALADVLGLAEGDPDAPARACSWVTTDWAWAWRLDGSGR